MADKIVFFSFMFIFIFISFLILILLSKLNKATKKDLKQAQKEINAYLEKQTKVKEAKEEHAKEKEKFRDNSIASANASVDFLHNLSKRKHKEK